MKVAFNGVGCGWGNNGGTQSIFRMADALLELGVDVELWSDIPNRFLWFKPKAPLILTTLKSAPETDVLINTGCNTTISTFNYPRKRIGVQWLRGHETWQKTEDELGHLYGLEMPLWANSEWFKSFLDCEVQYCGIPHDEFYRIDVKKTDKFTIGCLWNRMATKGGGVIHRMIRQLPSDSFDWQVFGKEAHCGSTGGPIDHIHYHGNPSMEEKRGIYSKCDVWLAPTELEGLHIPPMEAALCGVPVIANSVISAGNVDYCNKETALLYNDESEISDLIGKLKDNADMGSKMAKSMTGIIKTKIGSVDVNARRMLAKLRRLI